MIDDLFERFVGHPDASADTFLNKFHRQLSEAPPETIQLAGELLFVYFVPVADIGGAAKRAQISMVLSWSSSPVAVPADLDAVLDHGLAAYGTAQMHRPFQLAFLLEFMRRWKSLPTTDREAALADPWAFKAFDFSVPAGTAFSQQEALLAWLFPDTFEPIVSRDMKRRIASRFADLVLDSVDDVDRRLRQIRQALSDRFGAHFAFWAPLLGELQRRGIPITNWLGATYEPENDASFASASRWCAVR